MNEIVLAALELDDLGRLVASALHCDEQRVRPLARLVAEKTGGNPFFAIQFLTELAAEALLSFDAGIAAWTWDVARIAAKGYTDNIVQLMVVKLKRLPAAAQEGLKELACLGNIADFATLAIVRESSDEEIHSAFRDADASGPRYSPRICLPVCARPRAGGGVRTDPAGVATRGAPSHRTPAARGERNRSPRPSASSQWSTN